MDRLNAVLCVFRRIKEVKKTSEVDAIIKEILQDRESNVVTFINAHAVNLIHDNDDFLADVLSANYLFRDGIGVQIAGKMIGIPFGINMNGTDFIPLFLKYCHNKKIAFYGTAEPFISKAAKWAENNGLTIVNYLDGFQDEMIYVNSAVMEKPDVIVLGMGMPKQESVSIKLRNALPLNTVIINGGAIFDFLSERYPRAPTWMRRIGGEWIYRLIKEPRRLWRRYLVGNLLFLYRIVVLRLRINKTTIFN